MNPRLGWTINRGVLKHVAVSKQAARAPRRDNVWTRCPVTRIAKPVAGTSRANDEILTVQPCRVPPTARRDVPVSGTISSDATQFSIRAFLRFPASGFANLRKQDHKSLVTSERQSRNTSKNTAGSRRRPFIVHSSNIVHSSDIAEFISASSVTGGPSTKDARRLPCRPCDWTS